MGIQNNADHDFYMARCIELARIAKQRGNSPVGSLIVQDGQIIAEGIEGGKTFKDIICHAEIEAIRQARIHLQPHDLSACILYSTHEPCISCSYIIRHHRIGMVVIGTATGEIGGYSSVYPVLLDQTIKKWGAPPIIITGILENRCKELKGK